MNYIKLTQGYETIVDDEDYEYLNQFKWYFSRQGYAVRNGKKHSRITLHRVITNCPNNLHVDHINCNKLDNRKCNLRICNQSQNNRNTLKYKNKSSKYKGVSKASPNRWRAQIKLNYKKFHLGYFEIEEDAARAYNEKAKELFGEFANLNEIK